MGKCLYCGKEITRKDKKCKYCSYECAALYYKANRKYRESPKPRKDTLIKRSKKAKEVTEYKFYVYTRQTEQQKLLF